jgi:hypothetical protein
VVIRCRKQYAAAERLGADDEALRGIIHEAAG